MRKCRRLCSLLRRSAAKPVGDLCGRKILFAKPVCGRKEVVSRPVPKVCNSQPTLHLSGASISERWKVSLFHLPAGGWEGKKKRKSRGRKENWILANDARSESGIWKRRCWNERNSSSSSSRARLEERKEELEKETFTFRVFRVYIA